MSRRPAEQGATGAAAACAVLRVAVNTPVPRYFDYLPPRDAPPEALVPGVRLEVPFGRRRAIGVLVEAATTSDVPAGRLRRAFSLLDTQPVLDEELMALLRWATDYYHHPPGEVVATALPSRLRQGHALEGRSEAWRLTPPGRASDLSALKARAPRQAELVRLLQSGDATGSEVLAAAGKGWRKPLEALVTKGLVEQCAVVPATATRAVAKPGPDLTGAQAVAVQRIGQGLGQFHPCLLHGVTGSGKTEVYLRVAEKVLAAGHQALVLVPEIGLTPQLVERFRERLAVPLAVLHSGLTDPARLLAWREARSGAARIVLGTRSAVFCPLPQAGLIVVDEEHDSSYKQQEGFRYSARDLAVMRARRLGVPVVLGSATPSLESLYNVERGRYAKLELPDRPGAAAHPAVHLVDLRASPVRDGLSLPLEQAMRTHLDAGGQVLLFLNRRGYAPAWFCPGCGWLATCARCDATVTYHHRARRLRCHHCGSDRAVVETCPDCAGEPRPAGQGTERVEDVLKHRFADVPTARIDRDSTRRRGSIEALLDDVRSGATRILIGTQMLTKGHDFPAVTLVGVLNADQGLFGTDFRSNERLAQIIVQVAGRAGRAERPGEVMIQTEYPDHPLLQRLVTHGYSGFAESALAERREADWPPFASLVLLRAEATQADLPMQFLAEARAEAVRIGLRDVALLGPAAAPMARRAGRFRAQLLFHAPTRGPLHALLETLTPRLATLRLHRRVRWSLDVDPLELF